MRLGEVELGQVLERGAGTDQIAVDIIFDDVVVRAVDRAEDHLDGVRDRGVEKRAKLDVADPEVEIVALPIAVALRRVLHEAKAARDIFDRHEIVAVVAVRRTEVDLEARAVGEVVDRIDYEREAQGVSRRGTLPRGEDKGRRIGTAEVARARIVRQPEHPVAADIDDLVVRRARRRVGPALLTDH